MLARPVVTCAKHSDGGRTPTDGWPELLRNEDLERKDGYGYWDGKA